MSYEWHDLVGNAGVVCILGTYLLLQLGRMSPAMLSFSLVNGLGAMLILVSLSIDFNLSSFIIEIVWLAISAIGVWRSLRERVPGRSGAR
ncbi:MAG TPA: hypothetical protein VIS76_13635 [Pseudomonadales bacterium]